MAAAGLRIRIRGDKRLAQKLAVLRSRFPRDLALQLTDAARIVRARSVGSFLTARGMVVRGSRGPRLIGKRTPSNRLGVLTGRLRGSLTIRPATRLRLQSSVGTNVFYGEIHEVRGAGKRRIKRPFLRPALEHERNRIARLFRGRIRAIVRTF